jgi:uncharacterized delta-60 repeat protein
MKRLENSQGDRSRYARFEPLESRRLFNAGAPDTSFDFDGRNTVDFGNGITVVANDIAVGPDGKTVVVGRSSNGFFAVARFNLDGSLDPTFGTNFSGKVLTHMGDSGLDSGANAVAVQGDGKIVVAGFGVDSTLHDNAEFAIVRYNVDGTLDSTFDGDGKKRVSFGYWDKGSSARAVVIQSDGKIVVGGRSRYGSPDVGGDQNDDFAILRLHSDGRLDNSFDDDGKRIIGLGDWDRIHNLALDGNKIILVGHTDSAWSDDGHAVVMRLNSSGGNDGTFGDDGLVKIRFNPHTPTYAEGVLVQSGGRIVITGAGDGNFLMARLLSTGELDQGFGTAGTGWVSTDMGGADRADDIIRTADGGLIVAGLSVMGQIGQPGDAKIAFAAYNANGLVNTSYFTGGKQRMNFGGTAQLAAGPGRRFVCTGGPQFLTTRYLDAGANLVSIGTLSPIGSETAPGTVSFIVARLERLATPQRVYLDVWGTARPPGSFPLTRPIDYTGTNIHFGDGISSYTYVDILPNQTFTLVTIAPIDDTTAEGDETATFSIAQHPSYDIDAASSVALVIRDNDVAGGPTVMSSPFLYQTAQQVKFTFNQDVNMSISAADFLVSGPSGSVPFSFSYDTLSNTATLSFDGPLPDGQYLARVLAPGVFNGSGTAMTADYGTSFVTLGGDANCDGRVDIVDLGILATNWQQPLATFGHGDFDLNGIVDIGDLGILATNWQKALAAPGAPGTDFAQTTGRRIAVDVLD